MEKLKLTNERLINTLRTDDALAAFKTAVDNGQSRLALDILGDFLPSLVANIETLTPAPTASTKTDAPVALEEVGVKSAAKAKLTKASDTTSD